MTVERIIYMVAGLMVMLTVTLSHFHHEYWLFMTLFIGFNLFQTSFTQWCPLDRILRAVGIQTETEKRLAEKA